MTLEKKLKKSVQYSVLYQDRILKNDDQTDDALLIRADMHRLTKVIPTFSVMLSSLHMKER